MSDIPDANVTDLNSFLLSPLLYSYQLNDSMKRRVIKHFESIELPNDKIGQFRLEWEKLANTHYTNLKSELLSEIALSKLESLDPEFNQELEKFTQTESGDSKVSRIEETINELCYKNEFELKSKLLSSLKVLNEKLTEKCDQIEERVLKEQQAISTLYETVKQNMK